MKRYRVCVPDKDLKYFIDECSNGEFINVSSLRELLEKRKKTWNSRDDPIRCSVLDWLLAELDSSPRASPAGEGLKEKVTK